MATFDEAIKHMKTGCIASCNGNDYMIKGETLYYIHVRSRVPFTLTLYNSKNWRLK